MGKETDLIKQKLDLVEFIRSYLALYPAGKNFKALCPFHPEKTPSFIVSPERRTWHCFGCGEGGDIFQFIMKYENLEFPEALRFLAEKAGVTIQSISPTQQREFGILYDIHIDAVEFFKKELDKNTGASAYLASRKLSKETIAEFGIGYAPGGDALTLFLLKKGFDIADISRAGLAFKNQSGMYRDRFEKRIMFPIFNTTGKAVAFTGRVIPPEDDSSPKYINSPETPIFNKSRILYGFSNSKRAIAETHTVFLVEGQMDFLMLWQYGIKNTAAVSGTGFTREHMETMRRIADTIVLSFDNDDAGFRALERAAELFGKFDFHVKAIKLGIYKDPAEAVEKDAEFLKKAIDDAKPAFNMIIERYFPEGKDYEISEKKRIARHLLEKIAGINSRIEKENWLSELSKRSGIRVTSLEEELFTIQATLDAKNNTKETVKIKPEEKSRVSIISERLILLGFTDKEFSSILMASYKNDLPAEYFELLGKEGDGNESERAERMKMQASHEFGGIEKDLLKKEFNELVKQLSIERLKNEQERLKKEIQKDMSSGDEEKLKGHMNESSTIAKKINELQKNGQQK